jgi:hypothetical protein
VVSENFGRGGECRTENTEDTKYWSIGGFRGSMRVGRGKRLLRSFVRCFFNVLLAKICCRSKFLG